MRKNNFVVFLVFSALLLCNCRSEETEKLVGIWKLEILDINGTALRGTSLGNWLWEFNDKGGYLINVAGAVQKGKYTLHNRQLKLDPVGSKEPPGQIYSVAKLDSSALHLVSSTDKNKTMLFFIKIGSKEIGEKD